MGIQQHDFRGNGAHAAPSYVVGMLEPDHVLGELGLALDTAAALDGTDGNEPLRAEASNNLIGRNVGENARSGFRGDRSRRSREQSGADRRRSSGRQRRSCCDR